MARSFLNSSHLIVDDNLGLLLVHHGILHHGVNDDFLLHHGVLDHDGITAEASTTSNHEDLVINWGVSLGDHERANMGGEHKQEEDGAHADVPVSDSLIIKVREISALL